LSIYSAVFILEYLPKKHLKTISCLLQFHDSVLSSLLRMPITVCLICQCVK